MKKLMKAVVISAAAIAPLQANAVTGDIPFNGTVTHTCVINVGDAGVLGASADFKTLGSQETAGSAGTASIVATGNGFDISADAPSDFTSKPATDTSSNTFVAKYAATGATTIAETAGSTANDLKHGTTNVSIDLAATKSGADVFEAGAYSATVVLRCE